MEESNNQFAVPTQLGPEKKKAALSVIIARLWALKVIRQVWRSVGFKMFVLRFAIALLLALALLLAIAFAVMIRSS